MANVVEYECPRCGGRLEFDAALQKLRCPFCESVFTVEELQTLDAEAMETTEDADAIPQGAEALSHDGAWWQAADGMRIYGCNSCGAEIVTDATTAATTCPYCNNVVVMKGQFAGDLKPDLIVPFSKTKEQAIEQFKRHIRSQKYVPKVFSAQGHPEEIKGVYVPFWLFTANAEADITYNAQKVRAWSDRRFQYTETSHFHVRRAGTVRMENVPVDASSKMPDELMESIEPYQTDGAVSFTTAYLAGFLADRYDVDFSACKPRAVERMRISAEESMRATVKGYVGVTPARSLVTWEKADVKYALFPVWMLSTSWEGANYIFAMNGQTGKFVGDLPLDKQGFNRARIKNWLLVSVFIFIGMMLLTYFSL